MVTGRALHFVFKIPDRKLTAKFYREILGMKVLRHEEFADGCDAACNGPYANRWSKTMIGYGPEDSHFVIELTYNYGISQYEFGNDFRGITIKSKETIERARKNNWPITEENGLSVLKAPGGYKYYIINEPQPTGEEDPVQKVTLASSDLQKSIVYWKDVLQMKEYEKKERSVLLGYGDNQAKLELEDIGGKINRAKAYGRIAFAVPHAEQPDIKKKITDTGNTILTDLITLDTPGKASVRVIILADPVVLPVQFGKLSSNVILAMNFEDFPTSTRERAFNHPEVLFSVLVNFSDKGQEVLTAEFSNADGHEICFVDEEGFRQLSVPDYPSEAILDKYIAKETKSTLGSE